MINWEQGWVYSKCESNVRTYTFSPHTTWFSYFPSEMVVGSVDSARLPGDEYWPRHRVFGRSLFLYLEWE